MSVPEPPSHNDKSAAELPDYEISRERGRWVWVVLGLLLVAIIAAGVWRGPDLYREAKARRALDLIMQGEAAVKAGDFANASSLFRRGMLMAPGDPRVLARIDFQNASFGNAEALDRLRHKVEEKTATPEEALVVAERSVQARDVPASVLALGVIPETATPAFAGRVAATRIRLLVLQGKPAEAKQAAVAASASLPGVEGDGVRLLLAEILLRTDSPAEGDQLLRTLAAKSEPEGAAALRLLARYRISRPDATVLPASEITAQLEKHPSKTIEDDLLLAELALSVKPADRAAILSALVEKQKNRVGKVNERIIVGRWLIGKGDFDGAAQIVTEEDAISEKPALFVRMDALSGQKLWEESRQLLNKDTALPDELRHVFLARIAEELGDPAQAESEWSLAVAGLRLSDPQTISFVAHYMEARRRIPEAATAYRLLLDDPAAKTDALLGLARTLPPSTSVDDSLAIYQRLLETAPDLVEARLGEAYLMLLLDREIEQSQATAAQLAKAQPEVLAFQSVLALAELKSRQPAAALAAYTTEPDWSTASDAWKAVRVAVLEANGRHDEAEALRRQVLRKNLRVQEQELLSPRRSP